MLPIFKIEGANAFSKTKYRIENNFQSCEELVKQELNKPPCNFFLISKLKGYKPKLKENDFKTNLNESNE